MVDFGLRRTEYEKQKVLCVCSGIIVNLNAGGG